METFVLECHVKGPQWLEIRNIQTRTAKISTCQCEFVLPSLGKNISILPTSSLPPLRVVSFSLATFTPPNSNHAEIYSAAAMVYDGVKVDQATDAKNQSPATSCCVPLRRSRFSLRSGFALSSSILSSSQRPSKRIDCGLFRCEPKQSSSIPC